MEQVSLRGPTPLFLRSLDIISRYYASPKWVHHEISGFYAEYPNLTVWCKSVVDEQQFLLELRPMFGITKVQEIHLNDVVQALNNLIEETNGSYHSNKTCH